MKFTISEEIFIPTYQGNDTSPEDKKIKNYTKPINYSDYQSCLITSENGKSVNIEPERVAQYTITKIDNLYIEENGKEREIKKVKDLISAPLPIPFMDEIYLHCLKGVTENTAPLS